MLFSSLYILVLVKDFFHSWQILFLLAGNRNKFYFLIKLSVTVSWRSHSLGFLSWSNAASLMTFSPNLISDCGNERKNTETEEYDLLKHLLFKTSFDCHDTSRVTRPFWRRNFPPGAVKDNPRLYLLGSLAAFTSFKMSIKLLMVLVTLNLKQTTISLSCQPWEC